CDFLFYVLLDDFGAELDGEGSEEKVARDIIRGAQQVLVSCVDVVAPMRAKVSRVLPGLSIDYKPGKAAPAPAAAHACGSECEGECHHAAPKAPKVAAPLPQVDGGGWQVSK
ncbi:hypothetical protein KIPB_008826, partial [Kipferlia bialata]